MSPETFERLGLIRRDFKALIKTETDEEDRVTFVDSDIGVMFIFTEYATSFLDACRGPKPSDLSAS